jgi:hypothetical protein
MLMSVLLLLLLLPLPREVVGVFPIRYLLALYLC